ncbi:DUF2760 domain-containing protein [Pelagicoccus mobilis]|uniref:DUF2760 domain-containing protein n=1 Tax=Pelagicoccus mobilis TaxID=415221 RepID=A0A934RUF7_9BACT|nr:DUF2760 domain-containing protein [Pelagicoccus mobilis]MBK1877840.1 DUF2760 domain-containing protein [Pelagicoccus mobilis]
MKTKALVAGILIAILNGLMFVESLSVFNVYFVSGAIALALWLVLKAVTAGEVPKAEEEAVVPPTPEPIAPPPAPKNAAEAEVVAVLASLQNKGRLVDFLMDDISKYSDAQVGGAARVVHQGCKAAFSEMFTVEPVATEAEGAKVTVPVDAGEMYRLSGSIKDDGPHSGTLVHKGWKASKVNLPRVIKNEDGQLPAIAPAQVEVK